MSSDNCCLCASDEGILLDIFAGGGKAHCGKIELCLSVKIEKRNAVSTKICHKCAYELDACSKFVQKYRETKDIREGKSKRSKGYCALCLEPGVKGYIFELGEGTPLNNSLRKIREIFDDSFFKDQPKRLSICLNCRYNLDVLFDLKSVYQSTLDKLNDEKGTEASVYPRTKTSVVSRKTTYIPLPVLNGDKAYESDSSMSSAMPMRRKRGRPRKDSASSVAFRNCEQCDTAVECGIDMYRYHRTGRTVCKDCWLKMDPEKVTNSKRRKLGLVLKDVLVNPSKYTSVYKVERDAKGNTTFLITDDSSENEEKDPPVKRGRRAGQPVAKLTTDEAISGDKKKSTRRAASGKSSNREDEILEETIVQEMKKPSKRVVSGKWSNRDEEPPTKIPVKGRIKTAAERKEAFTSDSETMALRTRSNSVASLAKTARAGSLSDIETAMPVTKKLGRPRKIQAVKPVSPPKFVETRTQRLTRRAASAVETTVEKSIEKSVRKSVDKSVRKSVDNQIEKSVDKQIEKSVDKQIEKSVDKQIEKSVDESADKIDRPVRRTRANSLTSQDSVSSGRPTSSTRNTKSSEIGSSPPKTVRSKAKSVSPTTSASETELEAPFACGVCKVEYRNKLIGMAHELTHSKQPEVKLQRVAIPEIIIEEAPTEAPIAEEPEQQSHDVSSTSDHSPVNAESDATPIAKAPTETEMKLEADEKSDERDETSIAEEDTNVSVAETKETKTVNDDSVEVNEKRENDDETNVVEIREPETNDESRKIEERSANEEIDNDNAETEKYNDDKVTEERQEEDKSVSEQRRENEEAEKADFEEKTVEEEKEEDKGRHEEEDEEKAEEKDKEEVEEGDKEKVDEEDTAKVEEKDTEKVEEIDIEKIEENDTEKVEEIDIERVEENDTEKVEDIDIERVEKNDIENIEEKDKEKVEENDEEKIAENDEAKVAENDEEKIAENDEEKVAENDKEESIKDSTEEPVKANGVDADHETDSKIDRAESVEVAESNVETNGRIVDERTPEVSVEPEVVRPESRETLENENEDENEKSANHEKIVSAEEAENKSLESTLESAPVDVEAVDDDVAVRKETESIGVVTDVLREVFDLATAEVQKRLETERPNDEKCSTPVAETVENISREIQNSADMPSLEPLVEDRTGNERS